MYPKTYIKFAKSYPLQVILIIFLISEFTTKTLEHFGFEYYRIGAFIKIVFLIIVFALKLYSKFLIRIILFFCFLFVLSQFIVKTNLNLTEKLTGNILYVAKYLFVFVLADSLIKLNVSKKSIEETQTILFYFYRINFLIILIGILFNLELFQTYRGSDRFGFNGLIHMTSHASYIYCFSLIYVVYNFIRTKKTSVDFWVIVISGLLIGTKTLYFFYFLISLYLIHHFRLYRKLIFYILTLIILIFTHLYHDYIFEFLKNNFKELFDLYARSNLVTTITSTRNVLLMDTLSLAFNEYWSFLNYFLGGGFFNELRTEMAFIDLFLFWGPIGMLIYLQCYYKYILQHYMFHPFLKYAVFGLLLTAFFSGNIFTNAVIAIHVIIISNLLKLESVKV